MKFVSVLVLTAILAWPRPVVAGPEIVGDVGKAECQIALGMAKAAFDSTNFSLDWSIFAPDFAKAAVVLSRIGLDMSISDVKFDPTVFEPFQFEFVNRLYWQKEGHNGVRIVLVQEEISQGYSNNLFKIDSRLSRTDFLQVLPKIQKTGGEIFHFTGPRAQFWTPALVDEDWSTPTLLRSPETGELWAMVQNWLDFSGMRSWTVYLLQAEGPAVSPCRIRFASDAAYGLAAMPKAVRQFATLADEALGPDKDRGTGHRISRMRNEVASAWAVLTERPWALTGTPYNSRAEVDAGLKEWARGVPSRLALLHRLEAGFGRAERALATFYVKKFGLEPEVAARFSGYAMDFMLRSYFVFHSDDRQVRVPAVSVWPVLVR